MGLFDMTSECEPSLSRHSEVFYFDEVTCCDRSCLSFSCCFKYSSRSIKLKNS